MAVLAAGFALAESAVGRAAGDAVASLLAVVAAPVLQIFEPGLVRSGAELRGAAGWAVRVSEVCDGHGLAISLAAGLAAMATGLRQGLVRLAAGILAIQVFNLIRIVALALALARAPDGFDALHTGIFPLLTVALVAVLVLPLSRALRYLLLALPFLLLWLPFADVLSRPVVLPANLILSLSGMPEIGQIALRPSGWSVGTHLLAAQSAAGVELFLAPLRPSDFTLALPLILAAVVLARRPWGLVLALASIIAALALGAFTAVWALAAAQDHATLLVPDGEGAFLALDYAPSATAQAGVRLLQNVLVHLNLLVLPLIIAGPANRRGQANG